MSVPVPPVSLQLDTLMRCKSSPPAFKKRSASSLQVIPTRSHTMRVRVTLLDIMMNNKAKALSPIYNREPPGTLITGSAPCGDTSTFASSRCLSASFESV